MTDLAFDSWLGRLPPHWIRTRFGQDVVINEGQVDPTKEPWSSMVLVAPNHIESGTGRIISLETARDQGADSGKYRAKAGQVLYSKIRPALNKVAIAPVDCLCSADMYPISGRHHAVDNRFLAYWILARPFAAYATLMSDRVKMPKVNREEVAAAPWARPPLDEQLRIADFLDAETARIDALTSIQRQARTVLLERRAAYIYAAVTGGNAGDRMPSKLAWADSLPVVWRSVKLGHFARMGSGHTPSRSHPEWWEHCTIPWITTGEVSQVRDDRREVLTDTRECISEIGMANSAAELHCKGTVVLCRTASAGYSAVMGEDMATSQDFVTWTCGPLLDPFYLLWCLRSMRADLLGRLAMGSTHKTIYVPDLQMLRIPLPPVSEQERIVSSIRAANLAVDMTVDVVDRQLALLAERRQALITAAVTGGITV